MGSALSKTDCTKTCGRGQTSRQRVLIASTIHHPEIMEVLDRANLDLEVDSHHFLMVFMSGMVAASLIFFSTAYVYRRYHRYQPEFTPLLMDDDTEARI